MVEVQGQDWFVATLGALTPTIEANTTRTYTFGESKNAVLNRNTTYWVYVKGPDSAYDVSWRRVGTLDLDSGSAPNWRLNGAGRRRFGGAGSFSPFGNNVRLQLQVNGSPARIMGLAGSLALDREAAVAGDSVQRGERELRSRFNPHPDGNLHPAAGVLRDHLGRPHNGGLNFPGNGPRGQYERLPDVDAGHERRVRRHAIA